ncbi:hypothetical protein [Devosia sp. FJ2-5-3]|uniref:hypothetical protein n=1 Tax=Devosia sp. FJ2-5-3 TaxID=2976680 RepID=UPI0023D7D7A2|nr:hypothetical protein [Devosia sp. FJ2-5-3]WEJ57602.1 hypothetical protein N0P34_15560 [Devosia sp. FJ2-5-3]
MHRYSRLLGLVLLAGLATACASRPVGDFGRAQPSALHDAMLPAVGDFMARQRREPVSNFNQTDQEGEMHDRTWRFLVANNAKDWLFNTEAEMQRVRITRAKDFTFFPDRYYNWLKKTHYQSSRVRYATVNRHILADLDTLPKTFLSICAVQEVDRQRRVALNELTDLAPTAANDVRARRIENQWHVDWFVRAVNYRYDSYSYALENLLVETPHEQSVSVDAFLRRLKVWADRANRGDFCSGASGQGGQGDVAIPSRFQTMVRDTEVIAPK